MEPVVGRAARVGRRRGAAGGRCRHPGRSRRREATREAAKRGRLRSKTRAFIGRRPTGQRRTAPASAAWLVVPRRREPRRSIGTEGEGGLGAAVGLAPVLDVPTPPPGDGGQLGLGVDRHREAHRLQHGQVAGRVGVGHRLLEPEPLGLGVVGQHQGAGLADGGQLFEPAGELAVGLAQAGADDVVEQRTQRLDHQVEGTGDQDGAVAEGPVLADPGDAGRERLGQQQVVRRAPTRRRGAGRPGRPRSAGRTSGGSRPGPAGRGRAARAPPAPGRPRRRPVRPPGRWREANQA